MTRAVLDARDRWTADFGGAQFSLGRPFYRHLETGRAAEYFAHCAASDALVEAVLPGTQSAVRDRRATARPPNTAHPDDLRLRTPRACERHLAVLRRYTLTTLLGSALLFAVQPMVARALLPLTGGVPALWNTCVVFFQCALLAGYGYAHAAPALVGTRALAPLHVALLTLSLGALPLSFAGLPKVPEGDLTGWILAALALRVAPLFVLLSTGAPLLQRWFVRASGADPRPLLAASNVGSLAALLAYPIVLEPLLPLAAQARLFALGYVLYVGLVARAAWDARTTLPETAAAVARTTPWPVWLRFVALAFVPSSLMLGVTTHLATDVGSFPLLWVVPLAIYLGSFIAVFARPPAAPSARVTAPFLGLLLLMFLFTAPQVATRIPLVIGHLCLFGATAYLLHGELARTRLAAGSVTSFQLALAVGGALGGAFNALLAPRIFVRVTEYPLVMALALLLLPPPMPMPDSREREEAFLRSLGADPSAVLGPRRPAPRRARFTALDALVPLIVGAFSVALFRAPEMTRTPALVRLGLPLMVLVLASVGHRARLALGLIAILAAGRFDRSVVDASRTFYGVMRVDDLRGVRRFLHGTTLHGLQYLSVKRRDEPVAYYAPGSPIGQVMAALGPALDGRSVGVVGLGVGMLLAHARPAQRWTFYELDPEVVRIARAHFTWLHDARAPWRIVTGDARRTLARDRSARHGLLVLDAFSSDAIPTHLVTREALALYLARIDERGVIAFHVTNRHVALDGVVAALARDAGLTALLGRGTAASPDGPIPTTWVVLARRPEHLDALASDPRWHRLDHTASRRPWTDDFSNVLGVIRWR